MAKTSNVAKRFATNIWNAIATTWPIVFFGSVVAGLIWAPLQIKVVIVIGAVIGLAVAWFVSQWIKAKEDIRREKQETMDIIKNSK
jgi:membrane protein DedA with SNARE-associated domain